MKCPYCGKEYKTDVKFCSACGGNLTPDGPTTLTEEKDCSIMPPEHEHEPKPKSQKLLPIIIVSVILTIALIGAVIAALVPSSGDSKDSDNESTVAAHEKSDDNSTLPKENDEEPATTTVNTSKEEDPTEAPTETPTEAPTEENVAYNLEGKWTSTMDFGDIDPSLSGLEVICYLEFSDSNCSLTFDEDSYIHSFISFIEDYIAEMDMTMEEYLETVKMTEEELRAQIKESVSDYSENSRWSLHDNSITMLGTTYDLVYKSKDEIILTDKSGTTVTFTRIKENDLLDTDFFIGEWNAYFDVSEYLETEEAAILEVNLSLTRDSYTLAVSEESLDDIIDLAINEYKKDCKETGTTLEEVLGSTEEEIRQALREYFSDFYKSDTGSWSYKNGKLWLGDTGCTVRQVSATEFYFKNEELELNFKKDTVIFI